MGRHASPEPEPEPTPDAPAPQATHRTVVWIERVLLGLAAGAGILFVLHWAGTTWTAAIWIAVAIAVIVPAAAWLAGTVPGRDHPGRH